VKRLRAAILIAVVVLSNVFGNFFMSRGLKHRDLGGLDYVRVMFEPWVASGVLLLILWMVSRLYFLRMADLSYVLPVTSVGYVLNAVLGQAYLSEQLSAPRWTGTLLIVAGAALVGRTELRQ
jgi:uncharacterized membrane protein